MGKPNGGRETTEQAAEYEGGLDKELPPSLTRALLEGDDQSP